ncbi:L-threonylcarbamoyladenylate synthase [candidate division KSB1 bacterium]
MNTIKLDSTNTGEIVSESIKVLSEGGVIVYPTETAYGLGADIYNRKAVFRIYEIKERPGSMPLSVIISDKKMAESICGNITPLTAKIIEHFMPGPLTLILDAGHKLPEYMASDDGTAAFRIPGNLFCLKMLKEFGKPVTATSANLSGEPEARKIQDINKKVLSKADLVIDAGEIKSESVSTVVKFNGIDYDILREGAVKKSDIINFIQELNIEK